MFVQKAHPESEESDQWYVMLGWRPAFERVNRHVSMGPRHATPHVEPKRPRGMLSELASLHTGSRFRGQPDGVAHLASELLRRTPHSPEPASAGKLVEVSTAPPSRK